LTDMEMKQLIESLQRQLDQERDQTAFFSAQFEQMSARYEALLAKMDEADKSSESRINALIDQIVVLTEQLAYFQNQVLGSKSEQSKKGEASPEPVEACEGKDPIHSEMVEIPEPSPRAPQKKTKGHKANSVKDIPVKEITIDLNDDEQNCPRCGEPMKKNGNPAGSRTPDLPRQLPHHLLRMPLPRTRITENCADGKGTGSATPGLLCRPKCPGPYILYEVCPASPFEPAASRMGTVRLRRVESDPDQLDRRALKGLTDPDL